MAHRDDDSPINAATSCPTPTLPTAGDVVLAYISTQVDTVLDADLLSGRDDAVRRTRIAARRIRSCLAGFAPLFDPVAGQELRRELRWLGTALSAARDADVLRERLLRDVRALPGDLVLGPVAARIQAEMARAAAQAAPATDLDVARFRRLCEQLVAFRESPPLTRVAARPPTTILVKRLRKAVRGVEAADHAVDVAAPAQRVPTLHAVRKSTKRARYTAEATMGALGPAARDVAVGMKQVQSVLGRHQDAVIAQHALRGMGARAHGAGENGFTFGLLLGREQARADIAEADYPVALERALAAVTHL